MKNKKLKYMLLTLFFLTLTIASWFIKDVAGRNFCAFIFGMPTGWFLMDLIKALRK